MQEVTKMEWLPKFYFFQCLDTQARMSFRHNQLSVQITSASAENSSRYRIPDYFEIIWWWNNESPGHLSNNVRGMRGTAVDASTNIQ